MNLQFFGYLPDVDTIWQCWLSLYLGHRS